MPVSKAVLIAKIFAETSDRKIQATAINKAINLSWGEFKSHSDAVMGRTKSFQTVSYDSPEEKELSDSVYSNFGSTPQEGMKNVASAIATGQIVPVEDVERAAAEGAPELAHKDVGHEEVSDPPALAELIDEVLQLLMERQVDEDVVLEVKTLMSSFAESK